MFNNIKKKFLESSIGLAIVAGQVDAAVAKNNTNNQNPNKNFKEAIANNQVEFLKKLYFKSEEEKEKFYLAIIKGLKITQEHKINESTGDIEMITPGRYFQVHVAKINNQTALIKAVENEAHLQNNFKHIYYRAFNIMGEVKIPQGYLRAKAFDEYIKDYNQRKNGTIDPSWSIAKEKGVEAYYYIDEKEEKVKIAKAKIRISEYDRGRLVDSFLREKHQGMNGIVYIGESRKKALGVHLIESFAKEIATLKVKKIIIDDVIATDIRKKAQNGQKLLNAEDKFLDEHEKVLQKYRIKRGSNQKLVFISPSQRAAKEFFVGNLR